MNGSKEKTRHEPDPNSPDVRGVGDAMKPTKDEKRWMDAITRLGCCVCLGEGLGPSKAVVHHITSGGRRRGHLHTIPLCPSHHNSGLNNSFIVSVHPWKSRFQARYGSEEELLERTRRMVEARA